MTTSKKEVMEVRGTVARDVIGWMREIEAQAFALTKCTNYLYSESINPDERGQGRWTREMYFDYIERCEKRLGLSGQPRLVVRHVKKDEAGIPREHYHCVWSRIDAERRRAIHMPYDHDKLMMVTREFAHERGLRLPEGYDKQKVVERKRREYQMTWHDKWQQDRGGLPLEARKAQVTAAWERRDTPRSFVRSLEAMGYTLATGRRDYVLVDMHGFQKSLPRIIDDKKVRIEQVREFLRKDYPKDSCLASKRRWRSPKVHRAAKELFVKNEERAAREAKEKQRRDELHRKQQPRRQAVEQEAKALAERQRQARREFSARQWGERAALRQSHLQESHRIRIERAANKPTGLAAFLGRISGVALITKTIHRYRDGVRHREFLARKQELAERQKREAQALERRQQLETLTMQRHMKALELVEQRERKSLETKLVKERRVEERVRTERAPLAQAKVSEPHKDAFNKAAEKPIDLTAEFEKASGSGSAAGESAGDAAEAPAPESEIKVQRRKRTRDRSDEPERSSRRADRDNNGAPSEDPPRRRRDRDFDRGL
ncbi:MAG: relaxase [Pseudorhodoplanes sp.]|nr:relaxase [Pseudorhodoplanes sp.]